MKKRTWRGAYLIPVVLVLSSCATPTPVTRTMGDGHIQTFQYIRGVPNPAENDWALITVCGFSLDLDRGEFQRQFGFQAKTRDIARVRIYDVTAPPEELLVDDRKVNLTNDQYEASAKPVGLSREQLPWLYEGGTSEFIFKFVLTDSTGREQSLYQPSVHMAPVKQALTAHIQAWSTRVQEPRSTLAFAFDGRDWTIGHSGYDAQLALIEYILPGETVQDWTELVTWQFVQPGAGSAGDLAAISKELILKDCPAAVWQVLDSSASNIVYEWHHDGCGNFPAQHEIARFLTGRHGIHRIAYTIKTDSIPKAKRETWLRLIEQAKLNEP